MGLLYPFILSVKDNENPINFLMKNIETFFHYSQQTIKMRNDHFMYDRTIKNKEGEII